MRNDACLLIRNDAIGEKFSQGDRRDFKFAPWGVWRVCYMHSSKYRVCVQPVWPREMGPTTGSWVDIDAENIQFSLFEEISVSLPIDRFLKRGKDQMKPGGCVFSAIECFNKVLEFDSESVQVHKLRATAIHKSGQNLDQAIESINK